MKTSLMKYVQMKETHTSKNGNLKRFNIVWTKERKGAKNIKYRDFPFQRYLENKMRTSIIITYTRPSRWQCL